ncbi:transporter substrate-binding domain-containing protein [Marinomonas sp. 15G1-11]|uniref:histidine kinase n=1 Tax=Marinomonas phaeophyticola TaxID=3004091 RepID=A0ABT4JRN3_9GAMM|nr:transporter substrate-binding domain-containing protein [Marinomonas sp. 15G1-11]MCZ2721025.1 transporter substrate-binding domain-containing protein [Marinomonas sp. 15G1-11]
MRLFFRALFVIPMCALWGLFAIDSYAFETEGTILVAGDHNYPPYEFINEDGEPDGYNTELTLAIAEVMGMEVKIELGDWNQKRLQLEEGTIDVLQGIAQSKARTKTYQFSPPHAIIHQSIFTRKGNPKVTQLSDLRGKDIIVQKRGVAHDYLLQEGVNSPLILVDTHAAALRLLASGQHDYAIVANLPGLYLGRELELSNLLPVGKPFGAQHYGYAVLKGNDELLAQFSEGLAILINTGRQQAIYDKWLGPLEDPSAIWKTIGKITALISVLLFVILGGIMIWNRTLTKQVSRRTEELKLQQQQLVQADKMTSLGVLVAGVAHEINNPISLLLLNLPVLNDTFQDIEEILEEHYQAHGEFYVGGLEYSRMREELPLMLNDMLAGTARVRRIVDDLRDFSRHEPSSHDDFVDLNSTVSTAIRLVDNIIKNHSDHVTVDFGENLPTFKGNAQRIEQVMINLIVNACQALPSKNKGISIKTLYNQIDEQVQFIVTDEGCGIEAENLSRLSDPFFTTRREKGGTGLGLSVSERIVQEHKGHLSYQSSVGEGTQATLSLPVIKATHEH